MEFPVRSTAKRRRDVGGSGCASCARTGLGAVISIHGVSSYEMSRPLARRQAWGCSLRAPPRLYLHSRLRPGVEDRRDLGLQVSSHILSTFGMRPTFDTLSARGEFSSDNLFVHMTGMSDMSWQKVKEAGAQVSIAAQPGSGRGGFVDGSHECRERHRRR